MIKPSEELISGIRNGLQTLRDAQVEPMGLTLSPHDGSFGWGFFKFKALPGHPSPGNAGHGWSHPTNIEAFKAAHAPRNWPQGGSFPFDLMVTLDEVKEFALEIGKQTGFGTDFVLECAWRESEENDMTKPGAIGNLSDFNMLRGGAEHYAYYPDSMDEISYVDKECKPIDEEKEDRMRGNSRKLKKAEKVATDAYMTPPKTIAPLIVSGAWYINDLPGGIVAELPNGKLISFAISPFRAITEAPADVYTGQHPRKIKGQPLPAYLYQFYGLAKSDETLSEVIRVRVSPSEKERLDAAAAANGKTTSEFLRDYIRGL